jgi:ribonuclease-3
MQPEVLDFPLMKEALTHRSAGGKNNERLEFLGDAVLGLVVAEYLYHADATAKEGDLSRLRAYLVRKSTLGEIAKDLCLGEFIVLGPGELKSGGHRREAILADALEAIIGAVYLAKGYEYVKTFVLGLFQSRIAGMPGPEALKDSKTKLQEYLQARNLPLPAYHLLETTGDPHAQQFTVRCQVEYWAIEGIGRASSKREAEQEAARKILDIIREQQIG